MRTLLITLILLQSCTGLTQPKQLTDYNCPHPYSEVIKAEQYVMDIVFVPRELLPWGKLGQTHMLYLPEEAPEIDPAFFPFAVIEVADDLSAMQIEAVKHHENCHIYETLAVYDMTTDPEVIVQRHMDTLNHVGWNQGASVWWKAAKAKEKRINR